MAKKKVKRTATAFSVKHYNPPVTGKLSHASGVDLMTSVAAAPRIDIEAIVRDETRKFLAENLR